MSKWGLIFGALAILSHCDAFKVLVVFDMPSRSHGILGDGIVRILANSGHEVTYITPFPSKKPHPNVRQIDVASNVALIPTINITAILSKETDVTDPREMFSMMTKINVATITHKNVQDLLADEKQTFDVVIVEWMMSELNSGFAAVYGCPFIWLSSIEPHSLALSLIDEDLNPTYNPSFISGSLPPYSFTDRLKELGFLGLCKLLKTFYGVPEENAAYEKLFAPIIRKKGRVVPSFEDLKYNASLMLGNSHVSLGLPTRLPQNYKPVRGYHIDPEVKPLPEDLKKILDNAKNGLIYFSMGSNLKSKHMSKEMKRDLLKVFGGLKQTVLWKFEEALPDLPSNVHIVQWAPQPSILDHPNCILFITHGGGLSTTEAVHFGKPTIGIPVFGDQFANIGMAVNLGMTLKVDLAYDMADHLKVALEEMLSNPSYAARAKELSFVYHHRPATPQAEVAHWVEHVARTRGAPHLRSAALHVPFYQKCYLDLLALIFISLYGIKCVCKCIFKSICKKKPTQKKQKTN